MNTYIFKILLLLTVVFIPYKAFSSGIEEQLEKFDEQRPNRSHSQIELLDTNEERKVKTILGHSSTKHLEEYRTELEEQTRILTKMLNDTQKSRVTKIIKWAKFHANSSGKIRAGGYIVACISSVTWVISLTPLPCDVQNWMGIGATAGLAIGGGLLWLAKKSEETKDKLDDELTGIKGKSMHKLVLVDEEIERRRERRNEELRRLHDQIAERDARERANFRHQPKLYPGKAKEEVDATSAGSDDDEDEMQKPGNELQEVVVEKP